MAQTSLVWDGTTVGDAGAYGASVWSTMYSRLLGFDADSANSSVIRGIDNELKVTATSPASTQIEVGTGSALVQGKYYTNTATVTFTITANASGNPRIDAVVLRVDYSASVQTVRLAVKEGTAAASPANPTLTQSAGVLWEVPLAYIAVANGFASIAQTDIEDQRRWANVPDMTAIQVTNQSAGVLEKGSVVVYDATLSDYPLEVNTTTTEGDVDAVGIIEDSTGAGGGAGRIITRGITAVIGDSAISIGDFIVTSTTAGQATSGNKNRAFGVALTASGGAGETFLAYVNFPSLFPFELNQSSSIYTNASDYTTIAGSFVDVDAVNVIQSIITSGGDIYIEFQFYWAQAGSFASGFDIYDVTTGARVNATHTYGALYGTEHGSMTVWTIVSGLAAGVSHQFKLQFRGDTGTLTIYATTSRSPISMRIMEL